MSSTSTSTGIKNHYEDEPGKADEIQPFTVDTPKIQKKKSKRRPTFQDGVVQHFRDYCSSTSIHGFTYFGENRTCFECVWWIMAFIVSISGASYMITEIYTKWSDSPVIVSFATKRMPIYEIPFPAITVCPIIRIKKEFFNLTEYLETDVENRTEEMNKLANYMGLVCNEQYLDLKNQSRFIDDPDDFYRVMSKYKPDTLQLVEYQGKEYTFTDVFKETFTHEGLCYTFNRMRLQEIYSNIVDVNENYEGTKPSTWHPEKGYKKNVKASKSYPRRAMSSGMNNGLLLIMGDKISNNEIHCNPIVRGYTVTVHYPAGIPNTDNDFILLPADDFVAIPVDPSVVLTSKAVRRYDPEKRDCYFPSEKQLNYFKLYTMENCEMECLRNATLKRCGCVEYYMPHKLRNKLIRQRESEQLGVTESDDNDEDEDHEEEEEEEGEEYLCDCLPMCTDITYRAYVEPMSIKQEQMTILKKQMTENYAFIDFSKYQVSMALVYMRNNRISTTERNELYGPADFIANFGGLLGLFSGFSILSFLEIIYFLSLRIFGNIRLFGYWAGPRQ